MNKLFTTPRIPELIISYPFGGMIGRPKWRKKITTRRAACAAREGPRVVAVRAAQTMETALLGESDW